MHRSKRIFIPVILLPTLLALGIWYSRSQSAVVSGPITASGTVESVEVDISSEVAGRVTEVLVSKGQMVQAGQALFRLDDTLLKAQRQRASAALSAAEAGVLTADTSLEMARAGLAQAEAAQLAAAAGLDAALTQYELVLNTARLAEAPDRAAAWQSPKSTTLQPGWYFNKSEQTAALQAELKIADQSLQEAQARYDELFQSGQFSQVREAEERLAAAQAGWMIASQMLARARAQNNVDLLDAAQIIFDDAQAELEAAQADLQDLLAEEEALSLRQARAYLSLARERFDMALDGLALLKTGDEALQVQAAQALVDQAKAGLAQAEAGLQLARAAISQAEARQTQALSAVEQAQAELDLIDLQLGKLVITAPITGLVGSCAVQMGEVILPGASALTLNQAGQLTIRVYVPEDRYGQVKLNSTAQVKVDSFPGEAFSAYVVRIADRAEFTPRNVQTVEGRRTTVFAVEMEVQDPDGKLKAGMPADVTFGE